MNIRLTVVLPHNHSVDLNAIVSQALEFKQERVNSKGVQRTITRVSGTTARKTIMSHFTVKGQFMLELAQQWLKDAGLNYVSAGPALSTLKKSGHVKTIAPHRFEFVKALKDGEK